MIKGEFTIYTVENEEENLWGIFKVSQGDLFLFQKLFYEILSYDQVKKDLL